MISVSDLLGWIIGDLHHFQQYFVDIVTVSLIFEGNQSYQEKTTDLSQVTDKHHIKLY